VSLPSGVCIALARASQRLAAELDAVGVVDEAVQDGLSDGRFAERLVPVIDRELAGDSVESLCQAVVERDGGSRGEGLNNL
jgi:hypothetical protein